MHVLKSTHRWLRPDGVLLDLHPEPEQPAVEVVIGHRRSSLGRIDNTSLIANIHRARQTLSSMVREGWFVAERSSVFQFVSHFASVDDWLHHRQERRATSVVDQAIIDGARDLLVAGTQAELIVSEQVLAVRLVRVEKRA